MPRPKGSKNKAKATVTQIPQLTAAKDALLAEQPCYTLKDLAVNGRDIAETGLKGKEIGEALQYLLGEVMDGRADNSREALLACLAGREAPHD